MSDAEHDEQPDDADTDNADADDHDLYPNSELVEVPKPLLELLQGEPLEAGPYRLAYDVDHENHFTLRYNPDDHPHRWNISFKEVDHHGESDFLFSIPINVVDDIGSPNITRFLVGNVVEEAPVLDEVLVALSFHGTPRDIEELHRHPDRDIDPEDIEQRKREIFENYDE